MGDFVNGGFKGLQFAHALVNGNALFLIIGIALFVAADLLKGNRER